MKGRQTDSLAVGRGCQAIVIHFPTTPMQHASRLCEGVVTFRLRRKLTHPMSHLAVRLFYHKHTTRVDEEANPRTQTQQYRRSLPDAMHSSTALNRTEQVSVEQQTLVQRVAAVERKAEGDQEECRRPSWHQR